MSGFVLDTSGTVLLPHPTPEDPSGKWAGDPTQWSDLSPFTQGYVEALLASANETLPYNPSHPFRANGFSDLAPETLARIIADCEAAAFRLHGDWRAGGAHFWRNRQNSEFSRFPPLTVQLGDDGKVRFAAGDEPQTKENSQ